MQKRVNVVLYQPNHPRFKIFDSYLEVIDSLVWGLQALGYDTRFAVNSVDTSAVNIVFGWIPAFQVGLQNEFPPNSILYNLEQYATSSMRGAKTLEIAAQNYQIWDYSPANIPVWHDINPKYPVYYAPVSFAPNLMRMPSGVAEDFDMLYVGSLGAKRAEKVIACSSAGFGRSVVTLSGVWGEQRDAMIARSKLLLNISNENPKLTIFEVVRVSYYLANQKAVLCEDLPGFYVEPDLAKTLRFAAPGQLGEAALELLDDPDKRAAYARECHEVFRQRDVRDVIRGFFG